MNFILNHKYSDGNAPIRPEEAEQLIPRISTIGELNEYEALNILQARQWAFDNRTMRSTEPLEEPYVRELHRRMFDHVWKWAGMYRKHELNIGCDPREASGVRNFSASRNTSVACTPDSADSSANP